MFVHKVRWLERGFPSSWWWFCMSGTPICSDVFWEKINKGHSPILWRVWPFCLRRLAHHLCMHSHDLLLLAEKMCCGPRPCTNKYAPGHFVFQMPLGFSIKWEYWRVILMEMEEWLWQFSSSPGESSWITLVCAGGGYSFNTVLLLSPKFFLHSKAWSFSIMLSSLQRREIHLPTGTVLYIHTYGLNKSFLTLTRNDSL